MTPQASRGLWKIGCSSVTVPGTGHVPNVLAHMKEFPDYYERLERMEAEAERDWAAKKS